MNSTNIMEHTLDDTFADAATSDLLGTVAEHKDVLAQVIQELERLRSRVAYLENMSPPLAVTSIRERYCVYFQHKKATKGEAVLAVKKLLPMLEPFLSEEITVHAVMGGQKFGALRLEWESRAPRLRIVRSYLKAPVQSLVGFTIQEAAACEHC